MGFLSRPSLKLSLLLLAAELAVGTGTNTEHIAKVNTKRQLVTASQLRPAYDFVIVGGGTAGLTVADRLSEAFPASKSTVHSMSPRGVSSKAPSVNTTSWSKPRTSFTLSESMLTYLLLPRNRPGNRIRRDRRHTGNIRPAGPMGNFRTWGGILGFLLAAQPGHG